MGGPSGVSGQRDDAAVQAASRGCYLLARVVFLRCLGALYGVAFKVALDQNEALLGERGLTPVGPYMARLLGSSACGGNRWACAKVQRFAG